MKFLIFGCRCRPVFRPVVCPTRACDSQFGYGIRGGSVDLKSFAVQVVSVLHAKQIATSAQRAIHGKKVHKLSCCSKPRHPMPKSIGPDFTPVDG